MGIVKQSPLLRGFTPGIGSWLGMKISDLALARNWDSGIDPFLDPAILPTRPSFAQSVFGTAQIERDRLAVIGLSQHATQTVKWSVHPYADDDELRRRWREMLSDSQADEDLLGPVRGHATPTEAERRLRRYIRLRYAQLNFRPPTVSVAFFGADWQVGNENLWMVSCLVSHDVFSTLWGDLHDGHQVTVNCRIALCPEFVDSKYSSGVLPKTFGLLAHGTAASARGWLESLSWTLTRQYGPSTSSGA